MDPSEASLEGGSWAPCFFPRLDDPDLHQLRDVIRARGYTRKRLFGKSAPILQSASPRRLSHLEQLLENIPDDADVLRSLFGVPAATADAS